MKSREMISQEEWMKWLDGIITEIRAGSCLGVKCEADKAWNDANERAARIIANYKTGDGLFQR